MNSATKKPKKKHGCLRSFFIFFVIILVLIGGAYLYFRSQAPESVTYTEADITSFHDKTGITPGNYAFDLLAFMEGNLVANGSQEVDATFTSAEITGGFQDAASYLSQDESNLLFASILPSFTTEATIDGYNGSGMFDTINVRFTGQDQVEIFGTVTPRLKELYAYAPELESYAFAIDSVVDATLYMKLHLTHSQAGGLSLSVLSLTINGVPVPTSITSNYEGDVANQLNRAIARINGFEIEILEISEGSLYFKGMIPQSLHNATN